MILRGSFYSKVLKMDTGVSVVIPSNYIKSGKYKVCYLLHGLMGNSDSWLDNTMLPVYAAERNIIFVMPEAERSYYQDMKYGSRYFSYISRELPLIMKSVFNISSERKDTIIMGASMGGYGALRCAFLNPEQYGYCFAFSAGYLFFKDRVQNTMFDGYTNQKDFYPLYGENLEVNDDCEISFIAKECSEKNIKPFFYSSCGTEDWIYNDNIKFKELMESLNFEYEFEEFSGSHNWYFFDKALKRVLEKYF